MNSVILKPSITKKFDQFMTQGRILFFSAPCGFGKTAVARELLKGKNVFRALPEGESLRRDDSGTWDVMLADHLQMLKDPQDRQYLLTLIRENPEKRFVFLSRGAVPGWLLPFQLSGLMTSVWQEELLLERAETAAFLESRGISFSEVELTKIMRDSKGYPLVLSLAAEHMARGEHYGKGLLKKVTDELYQYYEDAIFNRFEMPMRRFLLTLAFFDEIEPELAKIASGDCHAAEHLAELKQDTGMFLADHTESLRFWAVFRDFLRWKQQKEYSEEEIRRIYSRAGLYYELRENYGKALAFYSQSDDKTKVSELIIKGTSLHPGMGHYEEMEAYFRMLSPEQIQASPALMQGMSMLCALHADYENSEKWYTALEKFAAARSKSDEAAKEARSRLLHLDISLPQRSVDSLISIINMAAQFITNRELKLPAFSVTSAMPSIMNGGKDFSEWSKKDDFLYATMRKPVEIILGKDGVGLADCAIAESKFEKGENIAGEILTLVSRLGEIQRKGTPDIEFAVVGLVVRSQIYNGCADIARNTLLALRNRFEEQGMARFFPNIDAMLCRIALRTGDMLEADDWYAEKAPKDTVTTRIMKRYQYLTQAMVELARGDNNAVLLTLAPLAPFFQTCRRHIDMIHLKTLSAAAKYRMEDASWQDDLQCAMDLAAEYGFIRTISGYGAVVLPMLEEHMPYRKKRFAEKLVKAVRAQAVCYPDFLQPAYRSLEKLTETEMQVLRLLCADKSNAEIGAILNIKLATVKSHISHILQKLGVSRRAEAKTIAQNLRMV